ncbi:MAG: DUF4293 family protein [Flavobacteriales bacterium]|jgi:hypothetical protein|nr:DUF4293 domain-containing protein [Flavobacteriaceae bacterium]MDO7581057.1 DUF4293 domain-containing protein [Flavobacteriaceae bacterium]MDO7592205.1 DUF4293 domain-containing protein [Flavobacteriaceae bacterium]MDO7598461.1 DUF4293 domain-containing protein [Flavobacteriaceae bacterium]MDO7603911.1 DUF4293 domain-containing protein [Flavobacteriaceae bacterium]
MIQRIQSVFLVLYIILNSLVTFRFSNEVKLDSDWFQTVSGLLPYVFIGFIGISLFLFSKRKIQIKINTLVLFCSFGFELYLNYMHYLEAETIQELLSVPLLLTVLSWISLILANKYIGKDEDLIRSVDRLR